MTQLHDVERRRVVASNLLRPIVLCPAWIFIVCDEEELNFIAANNSHRTGTSPACNAYSIHAAGRKPIRQGDRADNGDPFRVHSAVNPTQTR
jgi:hypothetical protein